MSTISPPAALLPTEAADTYASWFAWLGDPTRVRLLHAVATSVGGLTVGALTEMLGISQSTCSHHVRRLTEVGFLHVERVGTATRVSINEACCTGLPHAADAVMGALTLRPCCPEDLPADVSVRALRDEDWKRVRTIYAQGIATGLATFETTVPSRSRLDATWLPEHRWVAEIDGQVVGWAAAAPVSERECYSGVAETSVYVADGYRGRGVGKTLLHRHVTEADHAGLWTLQTSVFTENRPSIALLHAAGYRTVGIRERVAQLQGTWRDTVLLERRSEAVGSCESSAPQSS